jgi:hypothetical protein
MLFNRRVSKIEWGTVLLVEAGVNKLGKTCNLIVLHRYFPWYSNTLFAFCYGNHGGGSIFSLVSLYCNVKHRRFHEQLKEDEIS